MQYVTPHYVGQQQPQPQPQMIQNTPTLNYGYAPLYNPNAGYVPQPLPQQQQPMYNPMYNAPQVGGNLYMDVNAPPAYEMGMEPGNEEGQTTNQLKISPHKQNKTPQKKK